MSKLTLYKQAPSPNRKTFEGQGVHRPPRQGLAQGRLVEDGNRTDTDSSNQWVTETGGTAIVGQQPIRPGGKPHILLHSPSPSRERPSMSFEHSPKPVRPSKALELSDDSDSDTQFYEERKGEVIVVDASIDRKSARDAEVEVSVGLSKSPYRVVCHSPRAVHDSLRERSLLGSVEDAKAISVDRVPTIPLEGRTASADKDVARITQLLHQQKIMDDAEVENNKAAKVPEAAAHPRPMPNIRLFDQLASSDGDADDSSPLPLATGGASVSSSRKTRKDKQQVDARNQAMKIGKEEKKKKKGPRTVASRYMQASASVKPRGPMKATDRSILTKSSTILAKTTATTTKRSKKASQLSSSRMNNLYTSFCFARENSGLSTTPVLHGTSRHTSTPTERGTAVGAADGSIFQGFDASAIAPAPHSHSYSTPDTAGGKAADSLAYARGESGPKAGKALSRMRIQSKESSLGQSAGHSTLSSTDSRSASGYTPHKQSGTEVTQADLDLLYARYLQWLYLNSAAAKAFREQEKHVMAQLYGLHEENQKLESRKSELDVLLAKLGHAGRLDQALDIQEEGLEPVVPSLGPLDQQYASLAAGLDTTRHQLAVAGVLVPEDQETYTAQLQAALGESEQLLGELASMCRHRQPDVTACATALDTLKHTVQEQAQEMIRGQQLLETAETLTTQESSLLIQNIQSQQSTQLMI